MYLTAKNLSVGYGPCPVLKSFSLTVSKGEFLVVVGPNGSGKSTLVKAIARTLPLMAGQVLLEGSDIARLRPKELARHMAVVGQETRIDFEFTVEEVVQMGRLAHLGRFERWRPEDESAVHRALTFTNTLHLKDRLVTGLSGGERQRVHVARALAQQPQLLLLDEPTAHLDIAHQIELLDLVRKLNREQQLTVVAVLHDLNLASQYASRMLLLKEGRMYAAGAPNEVVTEENLLAVYGSRVKVTTHPVEGTPHVVLLSGDALQRESLAFH